MSKNKEVRKDILRNLREGAENEGIQLPRSLGFSRAKGVLIIEMSREPAKIDLQTDGSAFEGWALAVKRWVGEEEPGLEVHLSWKPSAINKERNGNYQRFLYRVIRFAELADWFKVGHGCKRYLDASVVLTKDGKPKRVDKPFLVNVPGTRKDVGVRKARSARGLGEREIEIQFHQYPNNLLELISWSGDLERQVPVGVFEGAINSNARVFPGAGGKVDLAAIDSRKGVALFELKKPGNVKIGAISELLFYAQVIRDIRQEVFTYRPDDMGGFKDAISSAGIIRGFVLADKIHPLLDRKAFGLLNDAFGGAGMKFGFIHYDEHFNCEQIWPAR